MRNLKSIAGFCAVKCLMYIQFYNFGFGRLIMVTTPSAHALFHAAALSVICSEAALKMYSTVRNISPFIAPIGLVQV
jgi:hypothetical protein